MTFNDFIEYSKAHIKEYLPDQYRDAEVQIQTIQKMNEHYTGMIVRPEGMESAPVANMDMFYASYLQNDDLESTIGDIGNMIMTAVPPEIALDLLKDYSELKTKLFVRLAPSEGCEDIMADSPHRLEEDLLMTYHIMIPAQDDGFLSARISNQMLSELGVNAKQLHNDAIENSAKILPVKVQSMMAALTGVEEEKPTMIVITNEVGTFGAGALFCEGILDQVSEKLDGNYYLLPSSVHEWIAVPDAAGHSREDLEMMVKSANSTVVDAADRLSDNVFHYDSQERLFERADKYEERQAVRAMEKAADRGSLLNKLQGKKEQITIDNHLDKDMHRQPGLAI